MIIYNNKVLFQSESNKADKLVIRFIHLALWPGSRPNPTHLSNFSPPRRAKVGNWLGDRNGNTKQTTLKSTDSDVVDMLN